MRRRRATLREIINRIIGAPDYDAYLAHMRECHGDVTPLSQDAFVRQRLEERYNTPGNRCC